MAETASAANTQNKAPQFHIEKLYLKDLSFESPHTPESFMQQGEPKVDFNMETRAQQRGPEHYEVVLHINVKVNLQDKVLFLVEMEYGGLFLVRNLPAEHLQPILSVECPHILFPFARQVVAQVVADGGYKPFIMDPINFAAVYQQSLQQRNQQNAGKPVTQ
ncbi:MAG: protein-export chaperone SecB [Magnetococcus sp. WYHC-3]